MRNGTLKAHYGGHASAGFGVAIAAAAIATPKPAEARCLGCWVGAGIAAGVIGGAIASSAYGYGYPAYGSYGGYYAPRRYYARRYYRY